MQQLVPNKPKWTPEDYYRLSKWQRKAFDDSFSWPADESWEVDECAEWCTYKQQCFFEWLFTDQPLGWQTILKRAAEGIHREYSHQACEADHRQCEEESPYERDYRKWCEDRDHRLRMDPRAWTPDLASYPGPRFDDDGNIIERHTRYTPGSSPREPCAASSSTTEAWLS